MTQECDWDQKGCCRYPDQVKNSILSIVFRGKDISRRQLVKKTFWTTPSYLQVTVNLLLSDRFENPKTVSVSGFLNSLASFWAQLRIVCVQVNSNQRGFMFLICILCLCKWKVCWGDIKESKRANFCHGHRPCALTLNSCWHLATWEGDFSVLNIHILHIFSSEIILTSW